VAVANFTIASTPRTFDRASNEWKDGEALFLRASAWKELGEHVAASLTKGSRVVAQGRLKQKSYETKEGEKRTSIEFEIDEIGPSLRYATAQVTRAASNGSGRPTVSAPAQPAAPDAWATTPSYDDVTPF
jgi:single-strand DNA-binding protein